MNKNKDKKLNWYDVTLAQFKELQTILEIEDELEKVVAMAELVLGNDVTDLPLQEFNEQLRRLEFLKTEIPTSVPPKHIELKEKKYDVTSLLGNITTAQYIDFMNYVKDNDTAKMLSVFVVPEGHKYNDGYDMQEVIKDMENIPIPVANSITSFFTAQFAKFIEIFQSSSIKKVKKDKTLSKEDKERIIQLIKTSAELVLLPLS